MTQSGSSAVPASAGREETRIETILPPGARVTARPDGSLTWTTAAPLAVVTTRTAERATGPQSFPPPAAPTPAQTADGRARWAAWLALAAGIAAAGFGLLRGWPMIGAGGGCVAAAAVAVLALSSIPAWVWTLGIVGVALAASGWALWRFYFRGSSPAPA